MLGATSRQHWPRCSKRRFQPRICPSERRGAATMIRLAGAALSTQIRGLFAPRINPGSADHPGRIIVPDFCRRLFNCRAGVSAVEFSLLAVPFLALVFVILNMALALFAQQVLQTATT